MNRSTKGVFAAATAAALLLGGAGSLAYWTGQREIPGGTFGSGHLSLTDNTCASALWKLDDDSDYVSQLLVPGDTLTKTCTFSIDGAGEHMTVSLDTATPGWTAANALTANLSVAATFSDENGVLADPAEVSGSSTITAEITVAFDGGDNDGNAINASNLSNVPTGLEAILDAVTVIATQGHSAT